MKRGQPWGQGQRRNPRDEESQKEQKWKMYYDRVKKNMEGSQEEKDIILRKRILRYFQDYRLSSDYFYIKRRDQNPSSIDISHVSATSLFLYGIDFLSIPKIKEYFSPYQVEVNIYDDSHCEVGFITSNQLMEAFYSKLLQKPNSVESFYQFFKSNYREMVEWREIKGYSEMTVERKMWARFITKYDFDEKREISSRVTMEAYETAKSQFLNKHEKIVVRDRDKKTHLTYSLSFMLNRKNTSGKGQSQRPCCCSHKMNKLLQLFECSCSHHSQRDREHYRYSKRREGDEDISERDRTRDKRDKRKRSPSKKGLFKTNQLVKPLPRIQEITKQSKNEADKHNRKFNHYAQAEAQLSQILPIGKKVDEQYSQDHLLKEMVEQFEKYQPFEKTDDSKQNNILDNSLSVVSYFQCDNDDDEEENNLNR